MLNIDKLVEKLCDIINLEKVLFDFYIILMGDVSMNNKKEGLFAIVCAFFVMFSSMINPVISASIAVVIFIGYGVYKLIKSKSNLWICHCTKKRVFEFNK
mgnify:CR=1 FL=1